MASDESIIKDGFPTLRKDCRCYKFWYNDVFIGDQAVYKVAGISQDFRRQMDGDNDFGLYKWDKKEQLRNQQMENDHAFDLIFG
jgi:hypothetical protein